jgi:hypothetical protein
VQISQVRQLIPAGIAAVIPALQPYGYATERAQPPCVMSGPARLVEPRMTHRGCQRWQLQLYVFTSMAVDDEGQAALDGYLAETGSGSVLAALYGMRARPGVLPLGGACNTLHVTGVDGYRPYVIGETMLYGAVIEIEVTG